MSKCSECRSSVKEAFTGDQSGGGAQRLRNKTNRTRVLSQNKS